jgi:hypothetical protein
MEEGRLPLLLCASATDQQFVLMRRLAVTVLLVGMTGGALANGIGQSLQGKVLLIVLRLR